MSDPYRLTSAPPAAPTPAPPTRATVVRTLLWVLLAVSVAGNSLASAGSLPAAFGIGFGLATAGCVAALVTRHLRRSR